MKNAKNSGQLRVAWTIASKPRHAYKDHNAWEIPEALYPLRDWLAHRHVDVKSLKTARQALKIAAILSGRQIKWPRRGEEFPALVGLQTQLVGARPLQPNPTARLKRMSKLGTFGAASDVRNIDPSTFYALAPSDAAGTKPVVE